MERVLSSFQSLKKEESSLFAMGYCMKNIRECYAVAEQAPILGRTCKGCLPSSLSFM